MRRVDRDGRQTPRIDYVALVDPETLQPVETITGPTLGRSWPCRIENTRLIDNCLLGRSTGSLEPCHAQTLFYIPAHVAGYPVFGFGLLLAVWAVASVGHAGVAGLAAWTSTADTLGYVPILAIVGAIIAWVLPAAVQAAGPAHPRLRRDDAAGRARRDGAGRVAGTGVGLSLRRDLLAGLLDDHAGHRRRQGVLRHPSTGPRVLAGSTPRPAAASGRCWARSSTSPRAGWWSTAAFFGGVVGMWLFARKYRIPLLAICDLIAPSMMLGLAIGRVGCLLNGCCFGVVCDEHPGRSRFPAGKAANLTPPDFTPPYEAQVQRGQMYGFTSAAIPRPRRSCWPSTPAGLAGRAGLKVGDRLGRINGEPMANCEAVYESLDERVCPPVGRWRSRCKTGRGRKSSCRRPSRRPQPASDTDPAAEHHRRPDLVPAAAGLFAVSPPRRRAFRRHVLDLSGDAVPGRKPAHRRGAGVRNRPEHLAGRQHADAAGGGGAVVPHPSPPKGDGQLFPRGGPRAATAANPRRDEKRSRAGAARKKRGP